MMLTTEGAILVLITLSFTTAMLAAWTMGQWLGEGHHPGPLR